MRRATAADADRLADFYADVLRSQDGRETEPAMGMRARDLMLQALFPKAPSKVWPIL